MYILICVVIIFSITYSKFLTIFTYLFDFYFPTIKCVEQFCLNAKNKALVGFVFYCTVFVFTYYYLSVSTSNNSKGAVPVFEKTTGSSKAAPSRAVMLKSLMLAIPAATTTYPLFQWIFKCFTGFDHRC